VAYEQFHSGSSPSTRKCPRQWTTAIGSTRCHRDRHDTRALVALLAITHRHSTPHSLRWMRRSLVPADSWPKPMPKLQRAQTVKEFGASSLEKRRRPVVAHRQTPKHRRSQGDHGSESALAWPSHPGTRRYKRHPAGAAILANRREQRIRGRLHALRAPQLAVTDRPSAFGRRSGKPKEAWPPPRPLPPPSYSAAFRGCTLSASII